MRAARITAPSGLALAMSVAVPIEVALCAGLPLWSEASQPLALLAVRALAAVLGGLTLGLLVWRVRGGLRAFVTRIESFAAVRVAVYLALVAIAATSILVACGLMASDADGETGTTLALLALLHGAWAVAVLTCPQRLAWSSRRARSLDLLAGNVVLALVLAEVLVVAYAKLWPSPLVWDEQSIDSHLEANRWEPGQPFFNFRLNSGGYHDEEFFAADDGDVVVACLTDSFGFGIVPYDHNFLTLAEGELRQRLGAGGGRVALHNFGVPGIGMSEYHHLLTGEVRETRPTHVLLCVFVGNDLDEYRSLRRRYATFQQWMSWHVAHRLMTVAAEVSAAAHVLEIGEAGVRTGDGRPAWIDDPELEPPTLSEATFLSKEERQARMMNVSLGRTRRRHAMFESALEHLGAACDVPLLVAVIPTHAQVDDALWAEVLAAVSDPEEYDRDLPQRMVVARCRELRLPVLDLLPALRQHAERSGQRVYHKRDLHWNAAGNQVAGNELAAFLLREIGGG